MRKEEAIQKYGAEWYESFKAKERIRRRERYARNPEYTKQYNAAHHETYRINIRDRNRLVLLMDMDLTGKVVHHNKYHSDNKDVGWFDDIQIMTPEEHVQWHQEHPEFIASENII